MARILHGTAGKHTKVTTRARKDRVSQSRSTRANVTQCQCNHMLNDLPAATQPQNLASADSQRAEMRGFQHIVSRCACLRHSRHTQASNVDKHLYKHEHSPRSCKRQERPTKHARNNHHNQRLPNTAVHSTLHTTQNDMLSAASTRGMYMYMTTQGWTCETEQTIGTCTEYDVTSHTHQ